jgi:GT2 family glycosyltransferase
MGSAGRARAAERFGLERARSEFAAVVAPLAPAHRVPGRPGAARAAATSLALVTVTHNSAGSLAALLDSVGHHIPGARIIVVDSASSDETLLVTRERRDTIMVDVVALEDNIGFGAACNVGVRGVSEPVVALVNPDVELLDDSLLELAAEAQRSDRLLAPLVLSPDGSRQDTAHPLPCSAAAVVHSLVPPAVLGRCGALLGVAPWKSRRPRRTGWAIGCAVVARTETLLRLGPFDEQIFLYGEDLDLCLRAGEAGVETWFWPHARVLHAGAHSTEPAFGGEPFELLARARHDVVSRRMGAGRARLDDTVQALTFTSRLALKRALGGGAERERRQLDAIRAARRRS